MNNSTSPRQMPITAIGNGILYRAIVSLPSHMTERDQPLQERIVFFESPSSEGCCQYLEELLAKVWCIDTDGWCDSGYIYNVHSADELRRNSYSGSDQPADLKLFEVGAGGNGIYAVGPDQIHYARGHGVDLFVTPRVAARLREALDIIELLYAAEARSRKAP